jgi:hypothetical protein
MTVSVYVGVVEYGVCAGATGQWAVGHIFVAESWML